MLKVLHDFTRESCKNMTLLLKTDPPQIRLKETSKKLRFLLSVEALGPFVEQHFLKTSKMRAVCAVCYMQAGTETAG